MMIVKSSWGKQRETASQLAAGALDAVAVRLFHRRFVIDWAE